jgi:hypothetical protein
MICNIAPMRPPNPLITNEKGRIICGPFNQSYATSFFPLTGLIGLTTQKRRDFDLVLIFFLFRVMPDCGYLWLCACGVMAACFSMRARHPVDQ